ncbi:MAG: hypothetical protein JXL97_01275, partial [Bacteroidales bacterium]|nr:hypothetical protein [Bacteroidales bacterium]
MKQPNTTIPVGKICKEDISFLVETYKKMGLNSLENLAKYISQEEINKTHEKLQDYEITPDPFLKKDNKIVLEIKINPLDEKKYVNISIYPNSEPSREQFLIKGTYDI